MPAMLRASRLYVRRVRLTAADYLAWERAQPLRHELFDGEVIAKPAESPRHYALCVGAIVALDLALRGRSYAGLSSDQRVALGDGAGFVYPDAGAVLGAVHLQDGPGDAVANPSILVEVLSRATEPRDRGLKWLAYQRLPSLTDYLLISQSEPRIEHFRRDASGWWRYRALVLGDRLELASGGALATGAIFGGAFDLRGDCYGRV
jgi:Uma2 family endonuclease